MHEEKHLYNLTCVNNKNMQETNENVNAHKYGQCEERPFGFGHPASHLIFCKEFK